MMVPKSLTVGLVTWALHSIARYVLQPHALPNGFIEGGSLLRNASSNCVPLFCQRSSCITAERLP